MSNTKLFSYEFGKIYELYITKIERKGRTIRELNDIIEWLTGYNTNTLQQAIDEKITLEEFFTCAPQLNPNASKITGTICGYRIEEIEDPLMKNIRYLDKMVDELAKGRPLEKICRL